MMMTAMTITMAHPVAPMEAAALMATANTTAKEAPMIVALPDLPVSSIFIYLDISRSLISRFE